MANSKHTVGRHQQGGPPKPIHRSRLVAKEFADSDGDGLFAATPPLETLRVLISEAATIELGKHEKVIMIADISRAFFEVPVIRDICVELPEEAKDEQDKGRDDVGKLRLSLYGTRDAAANSQRTVREFMEENGWKASGYCPCSFRQPVRDLIAMMHGEDCVVVGDRESTKWFKEKLKKRFEVKIQVVGSKGITNFEKMGRVSWADLSEEQDELQEVDEARILNRIVRITEEGWDYEADQRHADLFVKGSGMESANAAKTSGEDERDDYPEMMEELSAKEAREFCGLAARANYLAQDRPDLQYAAKEACRGMSSPSGCTRRHLDESRDTW